LFALLGDIIGKYLDKFRESENDKEKRINFFQILFWSGIGLVSIITYIPKGLDARQITLAIGSFFLIIYFAIRALKYLRIL